MFIRNLEKIELDENKVYAIFPVLQTVCNYRVKEFFGDLNSKGFTTGNGKAVSEFFGKYNYCNDQVAIYEIKDPTQTTLDKCLGARIKLIEPF